MSRAIALACSVSLTACFSDPPSTDDGGSQGTTSSQSDTTASSATAGPTTLGTDAASSGGEITTDTAATVDDTGSSSTGASDGTTGSDEAVVLDLDVAVCDATWLDDFGETVECPSVRADEAAVRNVGEASVFVEAFAMEITEDAFVTQPRVGALAELRGTFVLPGIDADTFLRGTLVCEFANGCLAEVTIAFAPVSSDEPPIQLSVTHVVSEDTRGLPIDVELPSLDEPTELLVTVRADTAGGADTVVWLSPRLVHDPS